MRTITKEQWNAKKKHGYASITDGQRFILSLEKEGTCLVPVIVTGMRSVRKSE